MNKKRHTARVADTKCGNINLVCYYDNSNNICQKQRMYEAFYDSPKTMLEVSVEADVLRGNICWYIGDWQKNDRVVLAYKKTCPISGHKAGFYTTNPAYRIENSQLTLFD